MMMNLLPYYYPWMLHQTIVHGFYSLLLLVRITLLTIQSQKQVREVEQSYFMGMVNETKKTRLPLILREQKQHVEKESQKKNLITLEESP